MSSLPTVGPANTEDPEPEIAALYASVLTERPTPGHYRDRSANLWADPKLLELKLFTKSHSHQDRLCRSGLLAMSGEPPDSQVDKAVQARLGWRATMDKQIARLLLDVELAHDHHNHDRSHRARCDHVDKVFHWYERHGKKEVQKERAGPSYLRYDKEGPVLPGSTRVAPMRSCSPLAKRSSTFVPSVLANTGATMVLGDSALADGVISRGVSG